MVFQPLIWPVGLDRFGRVSVATRYSTFNADCSVGKVPAVADGLAESGVERLDRVCRVNDLAQIDGEVEERDELVPSSLPSGDHRWVAIPQRSANSPKRAVAASRVGGV